LFLLSSIISLNLPLTGSNDHNEELRDLAMERADELEEKVKEVEAQLKQAQAELAKATEAAAANAKHEVTLVERLKAATSKLAGKHIPFLHSSIRPSIVRCHPSFF
jgi:hypothetical protein